MNTPRIKRCVEHERLIELVGAYADGEVTPEEVPVLEAHLLGCERCQQAVSLQREVRARLERQEMERAPAALRERIQAHLTDEIKTHPRRGLKQHWLIRPQVRAGWALAACLALVLGLYLGLWRSPGPQPIPMIAAALADYHHQLGHELPAVDAASLEKLEHSLPFPVTPIAGLRSHLIAAWSPRIRGEPAAALAYRLDGRVIVQYVVSESLFFRQPRLREAVAAHGVYVASAGQDSVVAWPGADNGSLLIGPVSVKQLESVRL